MRTGFGAMFAKKAIERKIKLFFTQIASKEMNCLIADWAFTCLKDHTNGREEYECIQIGQSTLDPNRFISLYLGISVSTNNESIALTIRDVSARYHIAVLDLRPKASTLIVSRPNTESGISSSS